MSARRPILWATREHKWYTELIHGDYESNGSGSTGSGHGDGEGGARQQIVRLFGPDDKPIVFENRKRVGFAD